jgi:hypothetical protein
MDHYLSLLEVLIYATAAEVMPLRRYGVAKIFIAL